MLPSTKLAALFCFSPCDPSLLLHKSCCFSPLFAPLLTLSLLSNRWQVWWWTRMARPTTCCQARGMRKWSFREWCRAAEAARTAPRANRRLSIKPSKPERCGGGTHYRKYYHCTARCVCINLSHGRCLLITTIVGCYLLSVSVSKDKSLTFIYSVCCLFPGLLWRTRFCPWTPEAVLVILLSDACCRLSMRQPHIMVFMLW